MTSNDNKILSHSQWNCKYHIVFAPKYRRKVFYESHRKAIMEIIRELCQWKGVEILEGEMAIDHTHCFDKRLNEGYAIRRAGLFIHDEIDLPFLDLETLHVLSSDIDDKMHVMIEVMCCFEVCHCFDDVEVNFQAVLSISAP